MIFNSAKKQKVFEKNGYIIEPLLNSSEILEIKAFYNETKKLAPISNFSTTIWSENKEYRKKVDLFLKSKLESKLEPILNKYTSVFSNYMVKGVGDDSHIGLHQDWTFVNEKQYTALNVWIPLIDTNEKNGCLQIVKGSHNFKNCIRGRNINSPYESISEFIISKFLTKLPVKKGNAIIFNEKLLHYSGENRSDSERLAVSIVMAPKNAQLIHFYKKQNETSNIERLEIDSSFFIDYSLFDSLDHLTSNKEKHNSNIKVSKTQFAFEYFLSNLF